jgi:Flp pilus assembly protein TadD
VLVAQGQVGEALRSYTASRTIRDRLARQDPANAQWQRDLAVSYMKLGTVEKQKDNTTAAVDFFTQARAISARLVEHDPTNAIWKNDLAWVERQIVALKK